MTPTASATDARFYQDMIVHHAQALVMVRAVLPDLTDPEVEGIASRIGDEQEPEMGAMARWLEGRGQQVPPEATNPNLTDHGAHSMPGMATAAEVDRLAAATGVEADRLFLTLMIRHHRGAIAMIEGITEAAPDTSKNVSVRTTGQPKSSPHPCSSPSRAATSSSSLNHRPATNPGSEPACPKRTRLSVFTTWRPRP